MLATPPPAHLIALDRAIGPVALNMSPLQVHAKLGPPSRVRGGSNKVGWIARTETFEARGITIEFLQGANRLYAYTISTTNRLDRTRSGIGVGSSETAVRRRVPGTVCRVDKTLGRYCRRPNEGGVGGTLFVLRAGRVSRVEVFAPVF